MNWISALAELQRSGEPCVLVTIIEERGSTPRNAGSKMVVIWMRSTSTWKTSATTWATLVLRPWPISVPPWFRWMLPSV